MKTIELLNKVVGLGFSREKALAEEEISEELANDILFGFECEEESN